MEQTIHFPLAQTDRESVVALLYESLVNWLYVFVGGDVLIFTIASSERRDDSVKVYAKGPNYRGGPYSA